MRKTVEKVKHKQTIHEPGIGNEQNTTSNGKTGRRKRERKHEINRKR